MMATTGFLKERQSFFSLFGSEAGCFSECLEAVSGCANVTWMSVAAKMGASFAARGGQTARDGIAARLGAILEFHPVWYLTV
jgi:hypothetical protein